MTKEEVLKAIRNHSSEIRIAMGVLEYQILSLVNGLRPEVPGEIDSLGSVLDYTKEKVDEIKDILDQWPE